MLTSTPVEYSGTWPIAGLIASGVGYLRPSAERRIGAIDGGAWPTPNVPNGGRSIRHAEQVGGSFYHNGKKVQFGLEAAVRMWPTPAARDYKSDRSTPEWREQRMAETRGKPLPFVVGGTLNPTWVEWLMGWPLGWTDLKPLETARFRQWCEAHGIC